jgi:hypothetical protein
LLFSSRLAELKKLLECIRLGNSDDPSALLLLEALCMHLHLSLDDLHLFAGVEGYNEAKRIFPALREWARTPAAREAVWHAAQILRHAKAMPIIRDFAAVIVYQAALALWCFGIISRGEDKRDEQVAILTGDETVEVNLFVTLGRGSPAVAGFKEDEPVLLSDVGGVVQTIKNLLGAKGEEDMLPSPKVVENILELLEELRRAVAG